MRKLELGEIVETRKQHPCGSNKWEITRLGADIKAKCLGCEHTIMMPRHKFLKMLKAKKEN